MNSTNTTTTDDNETVIGWASIYVTVLVSLIQGALFYALFLKLRRQEKEKQSFGLYEPRQNTRKHRSPEPFAASWLKAAYDVTQEELHKSVGLDSYMFLRFLRLGARLSAVGCLCSLLLIPLYATGGLENAKQFNRLTLARVGANSNRLYATVGAWWIFVAFTLYSFVEEWKLYKQHRFTFLARGDIDMPAEYRYAIRVEQVPAAMRSEEKLQQYFERLFPGKVQQVVACQQIDKLLKLTDELQAAKLKYEGAVAYAQAKPLKPKQTVRVSQKTGKPVGKMSCALFTEQDLVDYCQSEIDRLNAEIDAEQKKFGGGHVSTLSHLEGDEVEPKNSALDESIEIPAFAGSDVPKNKSSVPVDTSTSLENPETKSSGTAFVTFTSLRAKQAAIQCELSGNPDTLNVFPASDPAGILWTNVTVPLARQKVLEWQTTAFWTVGILFWSIPIAGIALISTVNSLLKLIGVKPADTNAFWYGLVSGLLPVILLAILMAVLYMAIVAAATSWVRYKSMAEVDASALFWHQLFQFANLWLLLIGGSLFSQIKPLADDPSSIVKIIALALPASSVFFINLMAVGSFGAFGLELSMLPTYGVSLIMNILQPVALRTQRQLDAAEKPPSIAWAQKLPPVVFSFLCVVIYMPIVPLMELFGLVYFGGSYLVWKHQCLHVYAQEFEGGGDATWQKLFGFLMPCLYMAEVLFIVYMGIKEAPVQGILAFFPLGATILVHAMLNRNIIQPLRNLSLEVAADVDISDGELATTDVEGARASSMIYAQPALNPDREREPMPYRRKLLAVSNWDTVEEVGK
jgi:calcium permeable stress-gated cation channel